ncbi:MAG: hypothetical protein H7Z42_21405 [Roseiflexaceae bacterium]|nr:hypothetical protein [Roseiflexaceae bacterium]
MKANSSTNGDTRRGPRPAAPAVDIQQLADRVYRLLQADARREQMRSGQQADRKMR